MQSFGTPILSQIGPMSYPDLIRLYDSRAREGRHYAVKTRWLGFRSVFGPCPPRASWRLSQLPHPG
jgi:hypothetical protein